MKQQGMTLIELMIVVAIIGILSSIAYPAYQQYVESSRRVNAQGKLLEIAQWMERQYTATGSYPANASLPSNYSNIPDTGTTHYNVAIIGAASNAVSYVLTATPVVNGPQSNDDCGTLSISDAGVKTASSGTLADCWRQ